MSVAENIKQDIEARYLARTLQSKLLHDRARSVLPGGETRESVTYKPYPIFMDHGRGCRLWDVDGNEYIDFLGNYTSLVHGHCDPDIDAAVRAQLEKGSVLGSPVASQAEHAEMLRARIPSVDMVRYTNSGTEATMWAIKAARAVSGKDMILKIEGGYHGSHDDAKVGLIPDLTQSGGIPTPTVSGHGVVKNVLDNVVAAPFNDLDIMEQLLKRHRGELAAILIEPVLASLGVVTPRAGYLEGVRELATRYGVFLIFDEVQSFRLSLGGVQLLEDVQPDITALGKLIGGGYAVGAFAGGVQIMDRFEFDEADPDSINHSGTFNGNDVTMVAGIAAMKKYDQQAVDRLDAMGEAFGRRMNDAFGKVGLGGQFTGMSSMWNVHFRDGDIVTALDFVTGLIPCFELQRLLHLELLNRGIFTAKRGFFVLSTPMTEAEIEHCVREFTETLELLRPYVAEAVPQLVQ
jgi:glutamate-1-semialdehyde 2,1-aminomutase